MWCIALWGFGFRSLYSFFFTKKSSLLTHIDVIRNQESKLLRPFLDCLILTNDQRQASLELKVNLSCFKLSFNNGIIEFTKYKDNFRIKRKYGKRFKMEERKERCKTQQKKNGRKCC